MVRRPKPDELKKIVGWFRDEREFFSKDADDADKIAGAGYAAEAPEVAAWTMVANVLLNLDETLTKE